MLLHKRSLTTQALSEAAASPTLSGRPGQLAVQPTGHRSCGYTALCTGSQLLRLSTGKAILPSPRRIVRQKAQGFPPGDSRSAHPFPLLSLLSDPSLRSHSPEKMPRGPLRWRLCQGRPGARTSHRGRRRPCPSGRAWTGWMTQVTVLSSIWLVCGSPKCCLGASWLLSGPPPSARVGVCPLGAAEPSHEASSPVHACNAVVFPTGQVPAETHGPAGGSWASALRSLAARSHSSLLFHVGQENMSQAGQKG